MSALVVGRRAELAAVADLWAGAADPGPAAVFRGGEGGIGKSMIWREGLAAARARGFVVLACSPAEAELRLSYSGLADLLVDVEPARFDALAIPQRCALDAALLRVAELGVTTDQRAIAAAFMAVLNGYAAQTPVLVAIDDAQWLDGPTRRVVGYAVRRGRGAIGVLATERTASLPHCASWLRTPDITRMCTMRVGALTVGALHHVVRQDTGRSFARPAMVRIAGLSAGNPFYAIEVARSLEGRQPASSWVSVTAEQLVRDRLAALDPAVREALLVVSAVAEPVPGVLRRATGAEDLADLLASMEDSGLVEVTGRRIRFTHPLWANAVYNEASKGRRRALHRRLGDLIDDVEERARHMALATVELDGATVTALDAAADHARRRGAVSAAAEFGELAFELGDTDVDRRIRVARDHFDGDDPARARELLTAVIDDLGAGHQRAQALSLLGAIVYRSEDFARSIEILEQAYLEAGDDIELRCLVALEVSFALAHSGRVAAATSYVATAVDEAEQIGDDGLLAEVSVVLIVLRVLQGDEVDTDRLVRGLALEDVDRRSHALRWPSFNAAALRAWRHDIEGARQAFADLYVRCVERGAESDLWLVLGEAMQVALWAGDVAAARAFADEMADRAQMTASPSIQALAAGSSGIVSAWCGEIDLARGVLTEGLAALAPSPFATAALYALAALGMLELSVGDHAAAADHLAPAAALFAAAGFRDPEVVPFGPDAAEALIALGRAAEAEPIVELLESTGRRPGRDWARAVGARCRGLLLAAAGDLDGASEAYTEAVDAHQRLPLLRHELARTLLVRGQLQRRRGDRRAARSSLQQAARLFDDVGASSWARNARSELERVGLQRGGSDQLTPAETRVAELAGTGHTNREVAGILFVSTKTVEAHLARIYRKLAIHSRAELGRRMAADQAAEIKPVSM